MHKPFRIRWQCTAPTANSTQIAAFVGSCNWPTQYFLCETTTKMQQLHEEAGGQVVVCNSYEVLLQNKTSYCPLKFQSMQGTRSMVQSLWIRSWELAWTAAAASSHKLLNPWSKAPSIPWLMPKRIGNIAVFKDSPTFRGSSSLHLTQDLAVPPAGKSKLRTQTNCYLLVTIYANSWFTRPEY